MAGLGGFGRGRRRRHLNAEVNIINLVDVVLVLLIIFMVTAPMMTGGIEVRLPRAVARPLPANDALTVTVDRDGGIAMDGTTVPFGQFEATLRSVVERRGTKTVNIRGDRDVSLGTLTRVMDVIRRAGVQGVGIVVEPAPR